MAAPSVQRHPFARLAGALFRARRRRAGVPEAGKGQKARQPPAPSTAAVRRVLVLYPFSRLLPALVEFDRGLREQVDGANGQSVEIYEEFLDWPRFDGPEHARTVVDYLRHKYAQTPPDVLVTARANGAQFTIDLRETVFERAAVLLAAMLPDDLAAFSPLPPGVTAVVAPEDYLQTAAFALRCHPRARRIVTVTGASQVDRSWAKQVQADLTRLPGHVDVEHWTGLPTTEVLTRIARLGRDSVVITTGYFRDGAGQRSLPREAVEVMARRSGAPVYAAVTTFIGTGVVGGYMIDYHQQGRAAGRVLSQLLASESRLSPLPPMVAPTTLHLDWREVRRWKISPRAIPGEAVVHFRKPPFHQAYRKEVLAATGVIALQAGLIGGLLWQRRRLGLAELAAARHRFELAHASRLAVAGELAGAIAHEINQPLAAILTNAEAADIVLESGRAQPDLLRDILADIRRDDIRASEVIRRLRALLQKQQVEPQSLDVNGLLDDVSLVLMPEALRRRVRLELRPAPVPAPTFGDRIQLQQVLINLVLNAMEAMAGLPEETRAVEVGVDVSGGTIAVTVKDTGPGIAPPLLERVFESFFTTKPSGMGLGLSIVRTLVEAHGGQIHAANREEGGAEFRIALPATPATGTRAQEEP